MWIHADWIRYSSLFSSLSHLLHDNHVHLIKRWRKIDRWKNAGMKVSIYGKLCGWNRISRDAFEYFIVLLLRVGFHFQSIRWYDACSTVYSITSENVFLFSFIMRLLFIHRCRCWLFLRGISQCRRCHGDWVWKEFLEKKNVL